MTRAETLQREAEVALAGALETASQGIETDQPALAELVVAKILAAAHLGACMGGCAHGEAKMCAEGRRLVEEASR